MKARSPAPSKRHKAAPLSLLRLALRSAATVIIKAFVLHRRLDSGGIDSVVASFVCSAPRAAKCDGGGGVFSKRARSLSLACSRGERRVVSPSPPRWRQSLSRGFWVESEVISADSRSAPAETRGGPAPPHPNPAPPLSSLAAVPSAATVVIVMCIAALVAVVVLGIYRIHLSHQQEIKLEEAAKEAGTSWDDSALTITVNPMEVREQDSSRAAPQNPVNLPRMLLTTESAGASGRRGGGQ